MLEDLQRRQIYVLGGGAVGLPLAASLRRIGKNVSLVRVRPSKNQPAIRTIEVKTGSFDFSASLPTCSLDDLERPEGLFIVATKTNANAAVAQRLKRQGARGPVLLLQNGLHVEKDFIEAGFSEIYRGVLYVTSELIGTDQVSFSAVAPSKVGLVFGDQHQTTALVQTLQSEVFPFEEALDITTCVWMKLAANCVFNSICSLVESDNSLFTRSTKALELAKAVLEEIHEVAEGYNIHLDKNQLLAQIKEISQNSKRLISTLQDIRRGQDTEIDSLNLAVAHLAVSLDPPRPVPLTLMLGELVRLKSLEKKSPTEGN